MRGCAPSSVGPPKRVGGGGALSCPDRLVGWGIVVGMSIYATPNYATVTEVRDYSPAAFDALTDSELHRIIAAACNIVRIHTRSALYEADEDGLPRLATARDALRDATAAQVTVWVENGLVKDVLSGGVSAEPVLESTSSNGKSLSLNSEQSTTARSKLLAGGLVPEAHGILKAAGLLGAMPGVLR